MLAGQKLQENGVEIALFPGLQLIANPHKDYIACDFGGADFYAPNKVIVKRNSSSAYHGVYFWTVEPVLTKDHGITHLSYLLLHDNDVSNLTVGKIIEQGQDWYQRGGFGPNGPKTYANHIHLCVATGHTLKTETVNGHQQLVGAVYPDQIFFINDTKVVKTSGMNWAEYKPKVEPVIEPVIETSPVEEPIVVVSNDKPIEEPIVAEPIATDNSCEEQKQPEQVVIVEPVLPVLSPIEEPTPIVEQVIEPVKIVEPVVVQKADTLFNIIMKIIIEFIIRLLKRKNT